MPDKVSPATSQTIIRHVFRFLRSEDGRDHDKDRKREREREGEGERITIILF